MRDAATIFTQNPQQLHHMLHIIDIAHKCPLRWETHKYQSNFVGDSKWAAAEGTGVTSWKVMEFQELLGENILISQIKRLKHLNQPNHINFHNKEHTFLEISLFVGDGWWWWDRWWIEKASGYVPRIQGEFICFLFANLIFLQGVKGWFKGWSWKHGVGLNICNHTTKHYKYQYKYLQPHHRQQQTSCHTS